MYNQKTIFKVTLILSTAKAQGSMANDLNENIYITLWVL